MNISREIVLMMDATKPHWRSVDIGSGNGLVPSGNMPLTGLMLIQFYVIIWRHQGTMSRSFPI